MDLAEVEFGVQDMYYVISLLCWRDMQRFNASLEQNIKKAKLFSTYELKIVTIRVFVYVKRSS